MLTPTTPPPTHRLRNGPIFKEDEHSYGSLYLQFTGDSPGFSSVSATEKKLFRSGQIYRKDAQWAETNEK